MRAYLFAPIAHAGGFVSAAKHLLLSVSLLTVFAFTAHAAPGDAFYALSGSNLIKISSTNPTVTTTTPIVNVAAGETLVGIDFRPQNGYLYGLGVNATANTATLYAISVRTGFAAIVNAAGVTAPTPSTITFTTDGVTVVDLPDPAVVGYGFDFNPSADRVRIVAGSLNFRVNPNTGGPVDGDNTGLTSGTVTGTNPDGSTNTGTTTVDGAGYTNNQPNNGNITTLYTLDAVSNSLFIQNPPNQGNQTLGQVITLSGNPLDFTTVDGFDISAGVNAASNNAAVTSGSGFAALNVGGVTGLYSINLVNAQAAFIGTIGNGTVAIQGLAVQSNLGGYPAISANAAGTSLMRFNTSTPGTLTTVAVGALSNSEQLVGIDFRPQTGQLIGLGINGSLNNGTLYLIDPQSGAVSPIGTPGQVAYTTNGTIALDFPDPATSGYGFDFNPSVDRIRVTTSTGLNLRINPNSGAAVDGDNGGAAGSVAGTNPDGSISGTVDLATITGVSAAAYTNSFGKVLTSPLPTTLYTLDAVTNKLLIQNPPNGGTQTGSNATSSTVTLGGAPLDFTDVNGFDIPGNVSVATSNAPATGTSFAALTVGGTTGLYSISLSTAAATNLGAIGAGTTTLAGFTLGDIPEPLTTAAEVQVSGRVLTADGRGVRGASVTITDEQGTSRTVATGSRGQYVFAGVETGHTYIVQVRSRRFSYQPKVVEIADNISDLDFVPEGNGKASPPQQRGQAKGVR